MVKLIAYGRSYLTNTRDSTSVPVRSTPTLILAFGFHVNEILNFVELSTTIGWRGTNFLVTPPAWSRLRIEILMDGNVVGSMEQHLTSDSEDEPFNMNASFQTALTNVPLGLRAFQVYVSNPDDQEGDIRLTGPVSCISRAYGI